MYVALAIYVYVRSEKVLVIGSSLKIGNFLWLWSKCVINIEISMELGIARGYLL